MAHYVICDNKCLEEGLSKRNTEKAIEDFAKGKADFALVEVTITTPEANSQDGLTGQEFANYPDGFDGDNCVVVSIMGNRIDTGNEAQWSTPIKPSGLSHILGNGDLAVTLQSGDIRVFCNKSGVGEPSSIINVKAVLMKV